MLHAHSDDQMLILMIKDKYLFIPIWVDAGYATELLQTTLQFWLLRSVKTA